MVNTYLNDNVDVESNYYPLDAVDSGYEQNEQQQQYYYPEKNGMPAMPTMAAPIMQEEEALAEELPVNENPHDLNKFDPRILTTKSIMLFLGARNTGKSFLLSDIMSWLENDIRALSVSSSTEETNHFYEQQLNIPVEFISDELNWRQLESAFFRQRAWALGGPPPGFTMQDMNCFFIWDDCMEDKEIYKSKMVKRVFYNGRHWDTGLAFLVQYFMDIPRNIRTQLDFIFVLAESSPQIKEGLWKMFFGMFQTYREFLAYFDFYTANHGVLVINNKERSDDFRKKVFWYRADPERANSKKTYPYSTMSTFHDLHFKPPMADQAPVNWSKVHDVSSLPEPDLGLDGNTGRRRQSASGSSHFGGAGGASSFGRPHKGALQYKFTYRDNSGRPTQG